MNADVSAILDHARAGLQELAVQTQELVDRYSDELPEEIHALFEAFCAAKKEAAVRLETPRLTIATIGTTSSGKSTVINAMVGRRIAPIEAGEMSGGVLTLRHADERRLVVQVSDGDHWEAGEWEELSDEDAYDRIRNDVMRPYHAARRAGYCPRLERGHRLGQFAFTKSTLSGLYARRAAALDGRPLPELCRGTDRRRRTKGARGPQTSGSALVTTGSEEEAEAKEADVRDVWRIRPACKGADPR